MRETNKAIIQQLLDIDNRAEMIERDRETIVEDRRAVLMKRQK